MGITDEKQIVGHSEYRAVGSGGTDDQLMTAQMRCPCHDPPYHWCKADWGIGNAKWVVLGRGGEEEKGRGEAEMKGWIK